jgi:hypothetical protein
LKTLKQLTLNLDVRVGRYLNITHPALIRSPQLQKLGHGVLTRKEWTEARLAGYNQAGIDSIALDTDTSYLARAFGIERRKLESGLRLANYIEHAGYRTILEVGCGEMITSWAIKSRLPAIQYFATDYDNFLIEKMKRLPILDPIAKNCVSIDDMDASYLRHYDLVTAWDLFYALDTKQMVSFMRNIKAASCTLVVCSSQIIGPVRALSYFLKSRLWNYAGQCRRGELRAHGFKCSVGYYRNIALKLGMSCKLIDNPPICDRVGDCYYFIEIATR